MKDKDNNAFLKSVSGALPIIKKNTISKPLPELKKKHIKKKKK